jgi:hypothetical protein
MKSNLQIARSIKDEDMRVDAGGLVPIKSYLGYVDGNPFRRSSRWWARYKEQAEGFNFISHGLISERSARGWTDEEATGAYHNEKLRDYRKRMNGDNAAKNHQIKEVVTNFLYRTAPCK